MSAPKAGRLVPLADVAEVLARYGRLRAGVSMDSEDGFVTVQIILPHEADCSNGLAATACADDLQYLADIATMRALCQQYGIPVITLEEALDRIRKE